jgi:hypothetical protein
MKDALIDFLSAKQSIILSDWKHRALQQWSSRVSSNAMTGKIGVTRAGSSSSIANLQMDELIGKLLAQFFDELLYLIKGKESSNGSHPKKLSFPNYTPAGKRFSLGLLMDILSVGEDVIMNVLVLESLGKHSFTPKEVAKNFERVNQSFHEMIIFYSKELCVECLKPIDEASDTVGKLTDQFQSHGPGYLPSNFFGEKEAKKE